MKIRIEPPSSRQDRWQVSVDNIRVGFRSEIEARQFVATLERRLQAPHRLPDAAQRAAG